jgi:hypothetical protein
MIFIGETKPSLGISRNLPNQASVPHETRFVTGRKQGYERIVLHASNEGRPLYESFGFEPANEMTLRL